MNLLLPQRRASIVFVVRKGFPVPTTNMTTLHFSKCLTTLRCNFRFLKCRLDSCWNIGALHCCLQI
ncbi:hypothetical protein Hanom_Chr10g00907011 [Helianthus anomalus]